MFNNVIVTIQNHSDFRPDHGKSIRLTPGKPKAQLGVRRFRRRAQDNRTPLQQRNFRTNRKTGRKMICFHYLCANFRMKSLKI
jgi:hypothetical protein